MNTKNIKTIILPLNVIKFKKYSAFSKSGSNQIVTAVGNEGIDLLKWIQEKIDNSELNTGSGSFTCDDISTCSEAITTIINKEYIEDLLSNSFTNLTYNDITNSFALTPGLDNQVLTTVSGVVQFSDIPVQNGLSINTSTRHVELGGTLTKNTNITGSKAFQFNLNDLRSFYVNTENSSGGTAKSIIDSSEVLSVPFRITHSTLDGVQHAELRLDADGNLTGVFQTSVVGVASVSILPSEAAIRFEPAVGTVRAFRAVSNGLFAQGLNVKTTQNKVIYWDETTQELVYGDEPSGGSSSILEYSAGNGVRVVANKAGITTGWSAGELTITLPNNTILFSAHVNLANASNVQSTADAGGATNWIRIKFVNTTGYNTSVTDMKVPNVQKSFYGATAPSLSSSYLIDIDNNPNVGIVGVGSNSVTLRIWNLSIPNGAQFTISNV